MLGLLGQGIHIECLSLVTCSNPKVGSLILLGLPEAMVYATIADGIKSYASADIIYIYMHNHPGVDRLSN